MARMFLVLGALSGFLAVAAGAFGAHGLKKTLDPPRLEVFEVAARYQLFHALALLAVGLIALQAATRASTVAGCSFVAGTLLFSGSLYAWALTGTKWFGAVTPVGGIAFLAGWLALAVVAARIGRRSG